MTRLAGKHNPDSPEGLREVKGSCGSNAAILTNFSSRHCFSNLALRLTHISRMMKKCLSIGIE